MCMLPCVCCRLLNYKQCNALKCQRSSDILLSWLLVGITKSCHDSIRSVPVIVNVLIDVGNINRHIYWVQLVSVAYSICSNRWYFHQNFNILSSYRRQMGKYMVESIKIPIGTGNNNKNRITSLKTNKRTYWKMIRTKSWTQLNWNITFSWKHFLKVSIFFSTFFLLFGCPSMHGWLHSYLWFWYSRVFMNGKQTSAKPYLP